VRSICGKRLGPYLPEIVPILERLGELKIADEVEKKLLTISPATIDRLLAPVRKRYQLQARSNTKRIASSKKSTRNGRFTLWNILSRTYSTG